MGSKTTAKSRLKGTAFKCDLCGRKFTTINTLKAHQRSVHNLQPKKPQPKPVVAKSKIRNVDKEKPKEAKSELVVKPTVSDVKPQTSAKDDVETGTSKQSLVEFECPKCFRRFLTYFLSLKHIQKFHCINKQGVKVPPNSPYLIQPMRIELCLKCKKKVHSIASHICDLTLLKTSLTESITYTCTACDQSFNTLRNFDSHVVWLHADDVESIFFPTTLEFTTWKEEMETQTNVKYTDVDKYESKFFYHCSHKIEPTSPDNANASNVCPSTLVVQEFTKGIQVHLYKKHYKHPFVEYNLGDKYKKYSINTYLKTSRDKLVSNYNVTEDEVYTKFKLAMEQIIIDAAYVDETTLKLLEEKAADMIKIIDNTDEQKREGDSCKISKNMSDTQITEALQETTDKLIKRKMDVDLIVEEIPMIKRTRNNQAITNTDDASSPKIINSFSLANNAKALEEINKENSILISKDTNLCDAQDGKKNVIDGASDVQINPKVVNATDQSLSTFNESYADFLVRNFNAVPDGNRRTKGIRKKTVSNTNKSMSISPGEQLVSQNQNLIILGSKKVDSPGHSKNNDLDQSKKITNKSPITKGLLEISKSSSPFTDNLLKQRRTSSPSQKKNNKTSNTNHKKNVPVGNKKIASPMLINKALLNQNKKNKGERKKNIVKTKIGQFTKSASLKKVIPKSKPQAKPKITAKSITMPRLSIEKPKVVVEYEIQEQEDDCNILILKI